MTSLLKHCNRLATRLVLPAPPSNLGATCLSRLCKHQSPIIMARTFNTTLNPVKKRRKRHPFFWLQDKERKYYDENLTQGNEAFFQDFLKNRYQLDSSSSPLKSEPWSTNTQFNDGIARTGVVAKKLGVIPMWLKSGKRVLTTCLAITDNHVIKYHSPEEFAKNARPMDARRFQGLGCIIVGADSRDPRKYTAEYNGLFTESGTMSKDKLTRFFINHESRLEPGTPLTASHFRPGMYVDTYSRSKEYGFVGLRMLHKMKLGSKTHGNTKNHNRVGSIGRGRKHAGPLKGRRMPGQLGGERKFAAGLKVWRVNTKYNLIFVSGAGIPGANGEYINVMDSRIFNKTPTLDNPPPFPTTTMEEHAKLPEDLYDPEICQPSDPSVIFVITEEERKAAALAARRLGMGKTAQKR